MGVKIQVQSFQRNEEIVMLIAKIRRVSIRPDYRKSAAFMLELIDNQTPQMRPLSFAAPLSWEGVIALRDACNVIIDRKADVGTGQESPHGTNEFTDIPGIDPPK